MRRSTKAPPRILLAAALLALPFLGGCGSGDLGETDAKYDPAAAKKKIEDDPNIPADAKAKMKAAYETGGGRGAPGKR